jgi:hypothetical protein
MRKSDIVLLDDFITFPVKFATSEDELVHAQRMRSNVLNQSHQSVFVFNDVLPEIIFPSL